MGERDTQTEPCTGCNGLVALAAREATKGVSAATLIDRLAQHGAGVRPGWPCLVDLALAGKNHLPGGGFIDSLDDGTDGQVRHFCGIAASCQRFGSRLTWLASVYVRRDAPNTPDGRLTNLAIEFVEHLRQGDVRVSEAPDWLRLHLCAAPPPSETEEREDDDVEPPVMLA